MLDANAMKGLLEVIGPHNMPESSEYGWFFRADDTTYILAGPGGQKFVSLPAVAAFLDYAVEQGR